LSNAAVVIETRRYLLLVLTYLQFPSYKIACCSCIRCFVNSQLLIAHIIRNPH